MNFVDNDDIWTISDFETQIHYYKYTETNWMLDPQTKNFYIEMGYT